MDIPYWVLWLIALLALLLTALLIAGEAAVLRVTRASLQHALAAAEAGIRPADKTRATKIKAAQRLISDPLSTVAALATVRIVACIIAGGALTLALRRFWFQSWALLLALFLIGLAVCVLASRFSPRHFGHRQPLRVAIALAPVLNWVCALTPWVPTLAADDGLDDEEARDMVVDRATESEAIQDEERELIRSVFELGDTIVREVMVPRTEMVTVPADAPNRKALKLLLRSGFSRVPVTGDSVDDLVGVVYLKDLARQIESDQLAGERPVSTVMRSATFIPESKPIDDLLRDMQTSTSHIAIVVDEYGGIAGLVTLEDVLEELVGELTDEHDQVVTKEPEEISPGVWRVPARLAIDELGDLFDKEIEDDDVDTAVGLLAKTLGKVPIAGSAADVEGLHLAVDRIEGRRRQVATLLVSKAQPPIDTGATPAVTKVASAE